MKGTIVVLMLLLAVVSMVQCLPSGRRPHIMRGKKAFDTLFYKRAVLPKMRPHLRPTRSQKAAVCKTSCDRANEALDLRSAQNCLTTLNKDFGASQGGVSQSEAQTYCTNHCDTLLIGIFNNITACCGDDEAGDIKAALEDSCKHNKQGLLCVQEDGLVSNFFTDPSQGKGQEFISCIGAYQGDTSTCPSECSGDILSYIANTIGCCYAGVAVIFGSDGGPASLVTSQLFTTCGLTMPSRCTS